MPVHTYKCLNKKCAHEFDVYYSTFASVPVEEPTEACPKCQSKKKEKQFPKDTSFVLKGTGWARDRYGK